MAKKKNTGNLTSSINTNTFLKGMNKDLNASFVPKESWFHAINAYNNSADGDAGTLGNEPANLRCADFPYPLIGAIHKEGDQWYVFLTDDVSSEIGLLDDSKCEYTTIVNDPCLNFNRKYLITGASKENYDCTWQVYWDDNLNPSRTLNVDDIPYRQIQLTGPDINGDPCVTFQDTDELDCEKIRLAPLVQTPCLELTRDIDGGVIRNGSYQAYIAYVVNEQVVTDYIGVSNIQSLFVHDDVGSSLNVKLSNLDQTFEFYELVILSNAKEQVVAKKIGIYSTEQNSVSIDFIDPALISVPLEQLFNRRPAYEKSESMYVVNDYLIRQGPTEQFDFNYQPIANQIQVKWQVAEYDADYYYKGGNKTSFMRDEQYAFFIRWIYNTGERSASYHIPGRAPRTSGFIGNGNSQSGSELDPAGSNVLNTDEQNWQVYNTAEQTAQFQPPIQLPDGGAILSEGIMGYWESTERYPATKPDIWDTLCGLNIRHHKMPSEEVSDTLHLSSNDGQKIRILGVKFENIQRPLFNDGTVIPNIVAYEILRGSREGAKSILAKGIFKNMRSYNIPNEDSSIGNPIGLYPNYPYNDLRDDYFFHTGDGLTGKRTEDIKPFELSIEEAPPLTGFRRDVFSFHTPELPFRKPYLNAYETRIYGKYKGESEGRFRKSEDHPGQKLLLNFPIVYAALLGMGYALLQYKGKQNVKNLPLQFVHLNPNFKNRIATGSSGTTGSIVYGTTTGPLQAGQLLDDNVGENLTQPYTGVAPGASAQLTTYAGLNTLTSFLDNLLDSFADIGGDILDLATGGLKSKAEQDTTNINTYKDITKFGGTQGGGLEIEFEGSNFKSLPSVLRIVMGIPGFLVYTAEGANVLIDLFYNLMSYQDYALKYNSHGYYTEIEKINQSHTFRSRNIASNYIGSSFNIFGDASNQLFKINNLFRPDTIAINTQDEFQDPSINDDLSRFTLGQLELQDLIDNVFSSFRDRKFTRPVCSLYGALKFKIDNQYGQIEGIKQTPMRGCIQYIEQDQPLTFPFETETFFTGDVYINRYTEKVTMPIFTDFLYGQPDGFVYDYLKYTNIPYPRYWMNTERYDFTKIYNVFGQLSTIFQNDPDEYFQILPSDLYSLDVPLLTPDPTTTVIGNLASFSSLPMLATQSLFAVTNGYMYTHINGVEDFFVESELNMSQRDWKEAPEKRHYDPYLYNNLNDLFNAKIQKADNFYLYDYSLSASRFITNLTSFGVVQPRDYDPQIAETCFTFYPKRLIYSLRAQEEAKKDFWRVFLPNNYKDFKNKVSVIKPVNQTGALMFFPYASPKMFMGVDQLQTDLGTKVILGDGGLFAREPQNITNSDLANEYASCESARSVINTPMGVFFISQAQGKIFQYTGKLQAISDQGMKWWFNKYLPSILLRQYPELEGTELEDNPVVGIGCQAVYDINDDIVYFMKKDYSVKDDFINNVIFDVNECQFRFTNDVSNFPIKLGDPFYFDNASWTVSYDPKIKGWISFHDWHPELSLPSVNHFLTTQTFLSDKPLCPPGYFLNNDTGLCEKQVNDTLPGIVDIDDVDSFTGNPCPDGFNFNAITGLCESTDILHATLSQTQFQACLKPGQGLAIANGFGNSGTWFYDTIITNNFTPPFGTIDQTGAITSTLLDANYQPITPFVKPKPSPSLTNINPWWPRLAKAGIWTCNSPSGNGNYVPLQEWIGFVTCVNVPSDREYCLLIAGDNKVRITIDGVLYAELGFAQNITFTRMHVFPVFLTAGNHSIAIEGFQANNPSVASFVGEIYELSIQDAIDPLFIPDAITLETYRIWSTLDEANNGTAFTTGATSGTTCPDGYTLVWNEDCTELVCQRIINLPPEETCACPDGYTLVYPDLTSNPIIWNQSIGDCESTVINNLGTDGNGQPVVETQSLECPIDIVFSIQTDDSISDPFFCGGYPCNRKLDSLLDFVEDFCNHPDIANGINSGNIQIGAQQILRTTVGSNIGCANCCPGGSTNPNYTDAFNDVLDFGFGTGTRITMTNSLQSGVTAASIGAGIKSWVSNNFYPSNFFFGTTRFVDYGLAFAIEDIIDQRATDSIAGDRFVTDPTNYRSIVIMVTGQINDWNTLPPNCFDSNSISNRFLSNNQSNFAFGPDYQYSFATYCSDNTTTNYLAPLVSSAGDHIFQLRDWGNNNPDYILPIQDMVNKLKEICNNPTTNVDVCDCYDYQVTILGGAPLPEYDIIYQECVTGTFLSQKIAVNTPTTIQCVREDSVSVVQAIDPNFLSIVEGDLCDTKYDCDSGPTQGPTFTTVEAICRKVDCGCPPSPIPNATLTQSGPGCESLPSLLFDVGDPNFVIPPGLIVCDYQALLEVPPSFERGSIWRHNYRCDLYANYYDVDYPWEVELIENTGQAVNTIRSFEYQLESYVYKGDLINGCGDDRWHDLDFNFDKSIIYNSEQVSGLLTLIPHPKEDPLTMITYPIIGGSDIQILYSKEEQKYRFNQFWDITRDRDEFTTYPAPTYQYQPGVTPLDSPGQNIFITQLNGYIKDLNQNNLAYSKTSDQRKKLRHYYNKVLLRRTLSGNRKMLLKLLNTKLNLSIR
jgi:hypothetical protein